MKPGMVANTFIPRIQKAEAELSLNLKSDWYMKLISEQSGLHRGESLTELMKEQQLLKSICL